MNQNSSFEDLQTTMSTQSKTEVAVEFIAAARRFIWLCAIGLIGFIPLQVQAQSDTPAVLKQLTEFTETLKSFSADFTQVVYDADSNPVQQSPGDVLLKRPGRFIWNYTSPSPQKIIADGDSVWLYDIELEQVTVSPLA